jgi:type IV fimbrial biogenesis protein FimT
MEKMVQTLKNKKGFTLIEMVVVIGIISILAMVTTPLMRQTIQNYKLKGAAREIYSNLQKAKLEAIKQNSNVVMAFTTGAYAAEGGVGGYETFIDNGGEDGTGTEGDSVRNGSEVIISAGSITKNITLITASFTGGTSKAKFTGQGLPIGFGGSVQVRNTTRWYKITVSSAGNIKLEISSDGTNFVL